jgi:two-component system chemotaxis response regulator CheB
LARIKSYGGVAVVQDPASAVSSAMPAAALAAAAVDAVLPLAEIAPYLNQFSQRMSRPSYAS